MANCILINHKQSEKTTMNNNNPICKIINTINGAILKLMKNNNNPICEVDEYGTKYWYLNGELHREDGPAAEYADGSKYWYVNDEKIEVPNNDNDIFLRMINLKAFW